MAWGSVRAEGGVINYPSADIEEEAEPAPRAAALIIIIIPVSRRRVEKTGGECMIHQVQGIPQTEESN